MNTKAPVMGTGATSNEMFSRALSDLNVDEAARDAAVIDLPRTDSTSLDANQGQFVAYFADKLRECRSQCERRLAEHALDRKAASSKIEIEQTRASVASLYNAIEPNLVRKKQDHQQDLEQAKGQEARSLRYLRHFQQENGLQNRSADKMPDTFWHFGLVGLFAVIEWVSLSIFYAQGSDYGLIGGILMAMALSVITITLAIFVGAVLRYLNHVDITRKILALIGVVILATVFLMAAGFAAHYRIAVGEVASKNANAATPPPTAGAPSTPTNSTTGEDDEWKASKLAWQNFTEQGVVFHDVLSWLLLILVSIFGLIAVWTGYGIDDRYPGYGKVWRNYEQGKADYQEEKKRYTDTVDSVFSTSSKAQQALLREVRKQIDFFRELASKSETAVNDFQKCVEQVIQTCNNVISRYRDVNRQVATSQRPTYFRDPVHFDSTLTDKPESISASDRARLSEYSAAIKEFSDLVQQDDARLQGLRTSHLARLDEFFEKIERDIDEKLAREAELSRA